MMRSSWVAAQLAASREGLNSMEIVRRPRSCAYSLTRPSLWSSGQSSWLRTQSSGFDSRSYQIFWEVVGTTEELLEIKSRGSDLENQEYGRTDPLCWSRNTLYSQKLALTTPTSGGRSVGIVRSRTKVTEFVSFVIMQVWRQSCCVLTDLCCS
jgi:hypothetical protein